MTKELAEAAVELNEILKNTSADVIEKIPKKFIEFMKENASTTYQFKYDKTKSLEQQNIKPKTRGLIALIYKDFLCNKEEKHEYMKNVSEMLEEIEQEKREKYNLDNIFKNKKTTQIEENDNLPEVIKKETFFKRLIKNIKKLFKK